MKAKVEITLRPFTVPNFVLAEAAIKQEGEPDNPRSFPLSALEPETLDRMCDEFREAVFKKAAMRPPDRVYTARD